MKVRKKPSVVEAEQFLPNQEKLPFRDAGVVILHDGKWFVHGLSGDIEIEDGDWVIKGAANGDYYPCKPKVFDELFEVVEDSSYDRLSLGKEE